LTSATSLTRVAIGRSPIHGRGVFARRRIRRGGLIGDFEGRETKRNGTHVLWVLEEDGSQVGIRGENELRFLNHSSFPNAEFSGASLYALRNIQPGREITFDYGDDWKDV
jgi:SET domain-containing protein